MLSISLPVLKTAAMLVTTTSTSKVVREVIRSNIATPTSTLARAQVGVGTFAIGSLVGAAAWERTEQQIDLAAAFVEGVKNRKNEPEQE